ncbi:hypothetical protein KWY38_04405 [Clostridioides difficile]|nr:hypothetical protein [Clostridioides difficile]
MFLNLYTKKDFNEIKANYEAAIEMIENLKEKHSKKEKIISDLENKNAALHTERMSLKNRNENYENMKRGMEAGAEILREEIRKLKEEKEVLKKQ